MRLRMMAVTILQPSSSATCDATVLHGYTISLKLWTRTFEHGTLGQPISPSKSFVRTTFTISRHPCSLKMVLSFLKPPPNSSPGNSTMRLHSASRHHSSRTTSSISAKTEPLTSPSVRTHPPSLRSKMPSRRSGQAKHQAQILKSSCRLCCPPITATLPAHLEPIGAH